MERALAWLDEAIYLGKKVLVHCRHGIGRTGTFVTAYLIRRGLGLKLAAKKWNSLMLPMPVMSNGVF
ncbi:MAG: protein-tyrosine phosphatase family protein [Dissulfurimicrobium sp.]|uniref:protein-tyrosine phosphatase family protein n=1 Tax=Dissulfurimicrobium sp. TaxID=2022436 RepID=UPI0040497DF7